jgi:aspartate/methionine/tyrosine aminotransferase
LPKLVEHVKTLQKAEHSPPIDEKLWNVCVTNGSQEALCRSFEALIDEGATMMMLADISHLYLN